MREGNEIPLRQTDEAELHSNDLLSKVAASLRESGAGDPTDVPEPDDARVDEDHEDGQDDDLEDDLDDEGNEDEGNPTSDEDAGEGEGEDQDEELEAGEGKDTPPSTNIPDAYLRSAAAMGWTPEAVESMVKDVGHNHVMTMLQNLHTKNNELTNQFAGLGRKQQELSQAPPSVVAPDANAPSDYSSVDIEALKAELGDDHHLVRVVEQQQKHMGTLKQTLDTVNQQLARTNIEVEQQKLQQVEAAKKTVNGFFSADNLKPFDKFYGTVDGETQDWTSLTEQQMFNRDRVCQMADQIMVGAEMHGTRMSLPEAMERAHLVVSEPIAASIIRQGILKDVEKRHKARVVRPSAGKRTEPKVNTGRPATRTELNARTQQRLAKVFGR